MAESVPELDERKLNIQLSDREFEVLELIAHGCRNREIAMALEIEVCTVRFHVENILDKLKVNNRTEAVSYAFRNGWITE